MAKLQQRTLKIYPNTDFEKAKKAYEEMIATEFAGYVKLPWWYNSFREERNSYGCDKLIVFANYIHNEWSPNTKEVYALLYKPKAD